MAQKEITLDESEVKNLVSTISGLCFNAHDELSKAHTLLHLLLGKTENREVEDALVKKISAILDEVSELCDKERNDFFKSYYGE